MAGKRNLFGMSKGVRIGLGFIFLFLTLALVGQAQTRPAAATQGGLNSAWRLPFLRTDHTAVFDAPNDRIIVFGGWNGRQFFNDVWALDMTEGSEAWTRLNPHGAWPPPRAQHTAIYDAANQRMIVFGGHQAHYNFNDVWALDLSTPGSETWTQLTPGGTAMPARRYHSAVYDSTHQRMVVFGGGGRGGLHNDVWALDLSTPGSETWSQLSVTGSVPSARWQHAAVYDFIDELMVVFGGSDGSTLRNDTWALNMATLHWAAISPSGDPPPARRKHSAVYYQPPHYNGRMLVFGGLGAGGVLNDLWYLTIEPGSMAWSQAATYGGPPATRAGHAAAFIPGRNDMIVLGGRGMDSLAGETQWLYDAPTVSWSPLSPTLPDWWQGGTAVQSTRGTQSSNRPDVTLLIDDAPPDSMVNVMPGQEVWFVTKIKTPASTYAHNITVTLDVVASNFDVLKVGTRYKDADEVTNWTTPAYLGGGQYQITGLELEKRGSDSKYQMQIVFRSNVKAGAAAGRTTINVVAMGPNWLNALEYNAYASIRTNPRAWIVTNRTQLFDDYDNGEVRSLLDKTFEIAQGGPEYNNAPGAVVLYADRYVPALKTWDNTTVNYSSKSKANEVATAFDQWLDGWAHYPNYLVILGDDNIIPFYRQYDETGGEGEEGSVWNNDPVLMDLVSNNYFFTDNPYGDVGGGVDWERGNLEIAVGRIVGASAADMEKGLRNGVLAPNPQSGRVIIASGTDMDWNLPGAQNDAVYPFNLMGYTYNSNLIDNTPSKTDVTREMAKGFAAMLLGGHGTVHGWISPGGYGPDWTSDTANGIDSREMGQYDANGSISAGRIFYNFVACRVGFSHTTAGADDSMVYSLTHHEASGGIAAAGLSCCVSDQDSLAPDETLLNDFWVQAARSARRSDPLGWAFKEAKRRFTFVGGYSDADNKKTLQEYIFFGLPWMKISGVSGGAALAASPPEGLAITPWSAPRPASSLATYAMTTTVDASTYVVTQTAEGFDLIRVDGMQTTFGEGKPVLPLTTVDLMLPLSATVGSLVFTPTQPATLNNLDIPSLKFETGSTAITATYATTVNGVYPVTATYDTRPMDTYQLVRVNVVPVTYDATNNQAVLYRRTDIRIEYDSPQMIALTYFEPDETQYVPGSVISTTAHLINTSDTSQTVTATLFIQDTQGQIVGLKGSGGFDVPAGGGYDLKLGWKGPLDGDVYLARLFIWQGGKMVAGAGRGIVVTAGQLSELNGPQSLLPGETGTFTVTFDNLGTSTSMAIGSLGIYGADGTLLGFVNPQATTVAGGSSGTLTFTWTPESAGTYVASAVVAAGGQEYGPLSRTVDVGHRIFLPLILR